MSSAIYAIFNSHDRRPVEGVASFEGRPHYFECGFDEAADEYGDLYKLVPITDSTFQRVKDEWGAWLRWKAAFDAGELQLDTHPAFSEESKGYRQIIDAIETSLKDSRTRSFQSRARFLPDGTVEWIVLRQPQTKNV